MIRRGATGITEGVQGRRRADRRVGYRIGSRPDVGSRALVRLAVGRRRLGSRAADRDGPPPRRLPGRGANEEDAARWPSMNR